MGYVGKHRDAKPKRRIVRTIALSLAVVLLALATGGYAVYRHLEGNITALDIDGQLGDRPDEIVDDAKPHKPMNILLLGSDTRVGQSGVLGQTPGLSDTTILLHLSADRSRAYGVSIPRDLMVTRPGCRDKVGNGTVPGGLDMWNAAYSYGGAVCTVAQFEEMTDIRVNHTIVVDFNGFKGMVDALGGVPICVPKQIDDEVGRIHLPAGTYTVSGNEALDYVRVRHVISNNGDIGRMRRQQAFLAAMTNEAVSAGTLINPVKLVGFLNAATNSLSTDKGLAKLSKLVDLAKQLKNIGLKNVEFLTMPIATYEPDHNRLAPAADADAFWARIRADRPLTKAQREDATDAEQPSRKPSRSPSESPSESPSGSPTSAPASASDEATAADAQTNGLCA